MFELLLNEENILGEVMAGSGNVPARFSAFVARVGAVAATELVISSPRDTASAARAVCAPPSAFPVFFK